MDGKRFVCGKDGRLRKQRDLTVECLNKIEGISCVNPKASLYAFPEIDLDMYKFNSDEEFIFKFLEEQHVLFVQGSGFNYNRSHAFRVVFLPHAETLTNAFERLELFLKANKR